MSTLLEIQHIRKEFPGVTALDDVDFSIKPGEVRALVGENGAGKSTLIKILTGVYQPDQGELFFKGEKTTIEDPLQGQMMGISVVHQELNLINDISVCENIFLGRPLMRRKFGISLIDWKLMEKESLSLLKRLRVNIDVHANVRQLSVAQKQLVEIAKALSFNCELMVMDEPSATLTEKELTVLFEIIRELKRQQVAVIYISHRLEEIFAIADSVTVLRDGRHISTIDVSSTNRNNLIVQMVGRSISSEFPQASHAVGEEVLEASGLTNDRLHDVSFSLRKGEIFGIAGLVGAGRTELARAVMGIDPIKSGSIKLYGDPVKFRDVTSAVQSGLGLVPEERKSQGLVLGMSVQENISICKIRKVERGMFISRKKEQEISNDYIRKLSIETPHSEQIVKNLSGGNQQKVVLAKWLLADVDILIFDEPTRGIDVGAKYEIYLLLHALVKSGKSIIMISSELPELMGMCDRIAVMHEGRITGELSRGEATQEKIMHFAAG